MENAEKIDACRDEIADLIGRCRGRRQGHACRQDLPLRVAVGKAGLARDVRSCGNRSDAGPTHACAGKVVLGRIAAERHTQYRKTQQTGKGMVGREEAHRLELEQKEADELTGALGRQNSVAAATG